PVGFDGSIIRVDPETGLALPDNPLIGNGVADDDKIIAHGLRNPYRFTTRPGSYDPGSGTGPEVYVSDTGWWRWEELNLIADATDGLVENFGWPCYAGNEFDTTDPDKNRQPNYDGENLLLCEDQYSGALPSPLTLPLLAYEHSNEVVADDGCLTGGSSAGALSFYETGRYPHEYDGALFFSDYSRQCMWVLYPGVDDAIDPDSIELFRDDVGLIVDLKTGPGGDLYFVSLGEFDPGTGSITPNSGSLKRIRYFTENEPPTAVAAADPPAGALPLEITFDGTGSTDPNEDPLSFKWDLDGDGQFDDSTDAIVIVTFTEESTITIGLEVDDGEWTDTDFLTVSPGSFAPVASIETAPAEWVTGETITLVGSGTDAEDGALTDSSLEWQISLHHCSAINSCHIHEITTIAGATAAFPGPEHAHPSFLTARLTVTDSDGLTDSIVVELEPSTVEVTIATVPPGLTVRAFNQEGPSPLILTAIEGSPLSISTDDPQVVDGFTHQFVSWSDGGAISHDLVPTDDVVVTAEFTYDLEVAPTWPEPQLNVGYKPTSLGLSWSGASDNAYVMGYRVFVNGQWMLTTPFTEYNMMGLDPASEYAVRIEAIDAEFNQSTDGPTALLRTQIEPIADGPGLVDDIGRWHLPDEDGLVAPFFFGVAGDFPLAGDWDCDGIDTPGLYRQSDGYAYLRNSNSTGIADVSFVFGAPGDVPIVGDFDGDGCDTVSVYRNSHVFIINELGENGGSLGAAELDYWFGVPGDVPFTGDFDGDGVDELGLFREASGFVYFTLDHPSGGPAFTDNEFFYGVPDDRIIAGDWTNNGTDTVGIYRESESTFYLRYSNSLGEADEVIVATAGSVPVAGAFVFAG
ncbi:MAG: PKD domain-containing protein, partial [Acidimicrobiia bacterium]